MVKGSDTDEKSTPPMMNRLGRSAGEDFDGAGGIVGAPGVGADVPTDVGRGVAVSVGSRVAVGLGNGVAVAVGDRVRVGSGVGVTVDAGRAIGVGLAASVAGSGITIAALRAKPIAIPITNTAGRNHLRYRVAIPWADM
ncbi:MAG: hypothetical protein J7M15_06130 [Anaerolineae bacterium]|nr:hypothetical protein [Anaerolineae bacterium]